MRAVAIGEGGRLEVVDRPEPEAGPHDVVLAVERCGICGSDIHLRASGMLPPGTVMGHEFAGTIASVGAEVTGLTTGQRVSALPAARCGTCPLCVAGRDHLCSMQGATSIGLGMNPGAYAEYVRVPASSCRVLPESMTPEQGALVEPYAVGLHGVRRSLAAAGAGVTAGIIGAGPIGLMTLAALKRSGVDGIVVAERGDQRRALAEAMGADTVVDDARRLGSASGGLDVVFDCAGVTATPAVALEVVRPGGQVVLVGVVNPGEQLPMPGLLWVIKEVDVLASIAYTDAEFSEAVDAVAEGIVDVLVSEVRPLEAAEDSFRDLVTEGGPVKVLLAP